VGDSSATTSPGLVTARRHRLIDSRQLLVMTMSLASWPQPMRRVWRATARRSDSSPGPSGYWHRVLRWRWVARLTARRTRSSSNRSAVGQAAPKEMWSSVVARRITSLAMALTSTSSEATGGREGSGSGRRRGRAATK
jgi:hypothetical protein